MAGPGGGGGGGGGDAAGDVIVVLDDDEEEAAAAAAAATPSAPPEAAAERPAPPAALPAENGRLFAEFVAFCSQHTREHPDVMPYLASRHQKSSPEFLASVEFRNVLGRCLSRVQAQRSKVYVYINELCTVLKAHSQRKRKLQPQPMAPGSASPPAAPPSGPSEQEPARPPRGGGGGSKRQIRYLENLLKLHAEEIRRLQAQELDLEALDREDSAYLQESRLKRRMMRIFQRLCALKDCGTLTGRVIEQRIPYRGTRYPEVNRRIERLINRPEAFPDYNDILKVVQKASARHGLGLPRHQMASMAASAFQEVGERLQERRRLDLVYNFGSYLTDEYRRENDPALADEDLARRLRRNRAEAVERLDQVMGRYVDLQARSEAGGWRPQQAGPSTGPPQAEPDSAVAAGESGSGPEQTQGETSAPDCEEEEEEEEEEEDDSLSSETDLEAELEKSVEGGEEEEEEEEEESLAPDPEDPPPAEADQSMGLKEPEVLLDSSADDEEEEEEEEEEDDGDEEEERGGRREEAAGEQPPPPEPQPPGALPALSSPPSQQFLLEIEAALPLEASETPPPSPPLRLAEHGGGLPPAGPERKPQPPLKHGRALENGGRAVNGQPPSKRARRGLAVPRSSCIEVLSAGSSEEEDGEGPPSPLSPHSPAPTADSTWADSPGLGLVTSSSPGSPPPPGSLVQVCKASVATQCDPEEIIVLSD